jgi:hypothetical protein
MKRIILLNLFAFAATCSFAQIDMGIPSATGKGGASTAMLTNWECIGVNPSNLGWESNYKFSIGVLNFGITAQSKAIDVKTLRKALTNPTDSFSTADKQKYADLFTTPDGLNLQMNVNWLAASIAFPKFGGLAINLRDRAYGHVGLNKNGADILFNGVNAQAYQDSSILTQNISSVFNGTNASFLHYRELNVAYGRRLLAFGTANADGIKPVQLFVGIGAKYIWGLGNMDVKIEDGQLVGHTSFTTNYDINYGAIQNFTPQSTSLVFDATGKGMAIDFGASLILKDKFRFAAAITDAGSINWTNNVLISSDTTMPALDSSSVGLNSWDLGGQSGFVFGNNGIMNYNAGSDYNTKLPTRLRLGFGMPLGERIQIGADVVVPMNNESFNLSQPFYAVGGEVNLFGTAKLNVGFSGNPDLGWNLPVGFTIGTFGIFEIYVATGDVLTFIDKSKNPNLSVAVGVLRFNLKNPLDNKETSGAQ